MKIISENTILLNGQAKDKENAIIQAGNLLVHGGYADSLYTKGMLEREYISSTYLENGVAIPHGKYEYLEYVNATGISVIQYRDGIEWNKEKIVHLVIGIAANSNDHIDILVNVAELAEDPVLVKQMVNTQDPSVILERLIRPVNQNLK